MSYTYTDDEVDGMMPVVIVVFIFAALALILWAGMKIAGPDCDGDSYRSPQTRSEHNYCYRKKIEEGSTFYKTCNNGTPVLKLKDGRLWQHGTRGFSSFIYGCPEDLPEGFNPIMHE